MPTPSPTLHIRLLGELAVYRDGVEVRLPRSKKTRALLGYLVLSGRPQRRARLCSLLWDVADDPRAALRWSLSKLRPVVNDATANRIVTDGDTVAFDPAGADIDVAGVRDALAGGVDGLTTEQLQEVAGTFRGELLEGLDLSDFDDFQAWCVAAREEMRGLHAAVLRALIECLRERPAEALPHARTLVAIEPVDEAVRAGLVELLVAAGRDAEARQQCEAGERQLRELGAEPTGALARALREVGGPRPAPAPAVEWVADAAPELDADTPLIGRHAERARLTSVLEQVRDAGRERVMLVSGEPGVGKTRLLIEVLDDVRQTEGAVFEGRAFEAERGRPFGPWIDAFRHVTSIRADDHLAPLLSERAPASAAATRAHMFTAAAELIADLAERAGLLAIAIDDVQWIDEASAELLHFLARTLRDAPVVIALTARDGEIVDNEPMQRVLRSLRRERLLDELDVGPLSQGDTESLVRAVSPQVDGARVFEQCGGNALFALELARSARDDDGGAVPPTLTEVVRARVDRLSPAAADLLRWAAVFGPTAPVDRLAALSSLDGESLMSALELLERHGLIRGEGAAYKLSHDVVRHVVYNELSQPRRRLMHRQIAARLHADGADDEATAADIAHHANLAGDATMAARACVAAARRSLKLFAKHDALALARRGARYAEALPEPERTQLGIELWDVRLAAETPEAREDVMDQLERLAEHALDLGALAHARLGFHLLSYLRWDVGDSVDASRHALQAEQLTRGFDGPQRVEALAEAARCLLKLDRELGRAEALALEARAVAARLGIEHWALADAFGLLRAHEGDLDEAAERFCDAQRVARHEQERLAEFQALEHRMMLELHRADVDAASRLAPRLLELGAKLREGSEGCTARALAAVTAVAGGDPGARGRLDAALDELRTVDAKQRLSFALLSAAELLLAAGDASAARAYAEEAVDLVVLLRLRSDAAWAHALIARAASALGDRAARDAHVEALRAADHRGVAAYALRASRDVLEID